LKGGGGVREERQRCLRGIRKKKKGGKNSFCPQEGSHLRKQREVVDSKRILWRQSRKKRTEPQKGATANTGEELPAYTKKREKGTRWDKKKRPLAEGQRCKVKRKKRKREDSAKSDFLPRTSKSREPPRQSPNASRREGVNGQLPGKGREESEAKGHGLQRKIEGKKLQRQTLAKQKWNTELTKRTPRILLE